MYAEVDDEAFVTLATNDYYCVGALVLAHSLKSLRTNRRLVVMVSNDISQPMRECLSDVFHQLVDVNVLDSNDPVNLELLSRPELGVTFTKVHCWRLTQFNKCVFMDADMVVLQNIDDLFDREELSACADVGWPDCFNSGLFVFRPSLQTYSNLLDYAITHGSFDGGDQGLLNLFFRDWATKDISRRLPFVYNMVTQASQMYQPAFKQFGRNTKVIHFIGPLKPWQYAYDVARGEVVVDETSIHSNNFLQLWWNIFIDKVKADLEVAYEMKASSSSEMYTIKLKIRKKKPARFQSDNSPAAHTNQFTTKLAVTK